MSFEKKEDPGKIFVMAALAELPILAGGAYQFYVTKNPIWLIGAVIVGGVLIMIPAVLRVKKIQERENASR